MLLDVHKKRTHVLDMQAVVTEFIGESEHRCGIFAAYIWAEWQWRRLMYNLTVITVWWVIWVFFYYRNISVLAGYPASLGPLLPCLPLSPSLPPCSLPSAPPSLHLRRGVNKCIDFLGSSWHFPDFWIFDTLKLPPSPYRVKKKKISGQFITFPGLLICWHPKKTHGTPHETSLVAIRRSCRNKGGTDRQTDWQTDRQTDRQRETAALYIVD